MVLSFMALLRWRTCCTSLGNRLPFDVFSASCHTKASSWSHYSYICCSCYVGCMPRKAAKLASRPQEAPHVIMPDWSWLSPLVLVLEMAASVSGCPVPRLP